jgi:hypothetical protein
MPQKGLQNGPIAIRKANAALVAFPVEPAPIPRESRKPRTYFPGDAVLLIRERRCGWSYSESVSRCSREVLAMRIPVIQGIIDRRILVNFRVDPELLTRILPKPFQPKLAHGAGMAGVCLIRLKQIRPRYLPAFLGISSENAAHRIAVQWEQGKERREGVFIPRRDTSSRLSTLVGGRLFPGKHHHARFQVTERNDHYQVALDSDDHRTHLAVDGHVASDLPKTSIFASLQEASEFFEQGSLGYSVTSQPNQFEGLELHSLNWKVQPLAVDNVESSFFDDRTLFPTGSVDFDCALLMRGIDHEWHGKEALVVDSQGCCHAR